MTDNNELLLELEKAELQCMESCEVQGFSLGDYIECKKQQIKRLEELTPK